jgi:hypothetical protein
MVTGLKAWTARRFDLLTVAVVILLVSAGGLVLILVSSGPGQFSINTSRETGHESGSDRTGGENRRPV